MSFFPLSYLNLNACEILIDTTTTPSNLNFHSIVKDTGSSISLVDTQTILLPANKTYFIKANVTFNKVLNVSSTTSVTLKITDENATNLNYQAMGYGIFSEVATGGLSGISCVSIDCMCLLFAQANDINIRFNLVATTGQEVTVEKDSANLYTPNSSITILYT
jgi:hypothetical protein